MREFAAFALAFPFVFVVGLACAAVIAALLDWLDSILFARRHGPLSCSADPREHTAFVRAADGSSWINGIRLPAANQGE